MGALDGDCESQQAHAETIHLWTEHAAMMTTYYTCMRIQNIRTPLTDKLPTQNITYSLCLHGGSSFLNFRAQYSSAPHGGTRHTAEHQRPLQGADVQQNERSWAVLSWCLSLCTSTSSYLHIVDCTHLTDWLFPKPQCPIPPTHYKHPTNLEHNTHHPPTHIHTLPFLLQALLVWGSVSESAYGDL